MSNYALFNEVMSKSKSSDWYSAVREWEIAGQGYDPSASHQCVCGKEGLVYLFTIENKYTKEILDPIGSSCINHFERDDLDSEISVRIQLIQLLNSYKKDGYLELSSDYFSRALLEYFYDKGVYKSNRFNNYDPYNDYEFMLKMFNKVKPPSAKQKGKIRAILLGGIKPYLDSLIRRGYY